MVVACRDCAREYELWPAGGCPNCGSAEPAAAPAPEPVGLPAPTRTRAGRRGRGTVAGDAP